MYIKFETKKIIEINIYELESEVKETERQKEVYINLLKDTLKKIKKYEDRKNIEYKIKAIKDKMKYLKNIQECKNKINFIKYFLNKA